MKNRENGRRERTRPAWHALLRVWAYIWASPNTLLGLLLGLLSLTTGGSVQRHRGALEFYGGALNVLLRCLPAGEAILAMTLGHVIIGASAKALDIARDHEWVHVRQYERWGPLMIPAYLLAAVYVFLQGKHAYRDNPFERAAYEAEPMRRQTRSEQDDKQ